MRITKIDKFVISAVLMSILVIGSVGNISRHLQTVPAPLKAQVSYKVQESNSAVGLNWPTIGKAAIGAKGYGVLASNGTHAPVPTASITKLITALAVLKVKPVEIDKQSPVITITQNDIDIFNDYVSKNGSVTPIVLGEKLTEYQMLQAILLPSANNLADTLAIWAFGSLANYSTYANKMLADYGLKNTFVGTDASGLSPTSVSTASDLVVLGEIALGNPVISSIVSQSKATLPVVGLVKNVNILLGTSGINGLKTGNSDEAGGAYLFSADYVVPNGNPITIFGTVMKSTDLLQAMTDSLALLRSSQKAFSLKTAITAGQVVGSYQVPWGSEVTVSAANDVKALAWQGKILDKPIVKLDSLKAPLAKNAVVGKIQSESSSISVKLDQPITQPSLWWRLTHNWTFSTN